MREADYWAQIDVPRNLWDPTEVATHSRHGERPFSMIEGLEVHWVGPGTVADHGDTSTELLAFERFHEETKGWYDLFYQVGVDSEGFTYECRDATIPSQSDLKRWLTCLVVQGTGDPPPPIAVYKRIYDLWGAVSPTREPSKLRYHGERASTSCPGEDIKTGVKLMRVGWNPYEQEEDDMEFNDLPKKPVPNGAKDDLAATNPKISDGKSPDDLAARWESIIMSNRAYKEAVAESRRYTDTAIRKAVEAIDPSVDVDLPELVAKVTQDVLKALDGTELVITEQTRATLDL